MIQRGQKRYLMDASLAYSLRVEEGRRLSLNDCSRPPCPFIFGLDRVHL